MSDVIGFVYRWQWVGHDDPPDGVRVLFEKFVPGHARRCPPELDAMWRPGTGYAVCVESVEKPGRRQSPETVGKRRRDSLRKRLERDYPLFAEQMYNAEIANRPDYYAGRHPKDAERDELERALWDRYERFAKIVAEMEQAKEPTL